MIGTHTATCPNKGLHYQDSQFHMKSITAFLLNMLKTCHVYKRSPHKTDHSKFPVVKIHCKTNRYLITLICKPT